MKGLYTTLVATISPIRKRAVWHCEHYHDYRRYANRRATVYETVRRYGHDSGEIWHQLQKNLLD